MSEHKAQKAKKEADSLAFALFEDEFAVGRWVVCPDGYRWRRDLRALPDSGDQGPWLVPNSHLRRRYAILKRRRLLVAFAKLARMPSENAVREFATEWGPLGYREATLSPSNATAPTADWETGESLAVWLDELSRFRMLHQIWQDVATMDREDERGPETVASARFALRTRRKGDRIDLLIDSQRHGRRGFITAVWPVPGDDEVRERLIRASDVEVARYVLLREVNDRLSEVKLVALPFLAGKMRLAPSSLLGAVYLRLAQQFDPNAKPTLPEKPCGGCGEPLLPWRRGLKYHDRRCKELAGSRRRRARAPRAARNGRQTAGA